MIETIKLWVQNLEKEREKWFTQKENLKANLPPFMRDVASEEIPIVLPRKIKKITRDEKEAIKQYLSNEVELKSVVITQLKYEVYILQCRLNKIKDLDNHYHFGVEDEKEIMHKNEHIETYTKKKEALEAALKYIDIVDSTTYNITRGGRKRKAKKRGKRTFRNTIRKNNIKTKRRF